jgi:ketosteroid isomerase-like protein
MLTENDARDLASHWIRAWNAHDLDEIMSHYAEEVVLVSPVAAKILNEPSGTVKGKEALRAYFRRGLDVYPTVLAAANNTNEASTARAGIAYMA